MTTSELERWFLSLDDGAARCPFPFYEAVQHEQGLYYSELLKAFVVTRFDDIIKIALDPETYSSRDSSGPRSARDADTERLRTIATAEPEFAPCLQDRPFVDPPPVLVLADGVSHARTRRVVNLVFAARRVDRLEPRIRTIAGTLIDKIAPKGQSDLVEDLTHPYPSLVICEALGVPATDWHQFNSWIHDIALGLGNPHMTDDTIRRRLRAQRDMNGYLRQLLEERRRQPKDDLVSVIAQGGAGEADLTPEEQLEIVSQLLFAGNETTGNLLATSLLALSTNVDLQDRLRRQPSEIPSFLEEMLRLESPVQGQFRTATRDAEVAGTTIPAGSSLFLAFAGANRDASRYPNASEVDLDRAEQGGQAHLGFGRGIHFCVGAPLARLDTRIVLELLLERIPDFRYDGEPEEAPYVRSFVLHGPASVPVRFTPQPTIGSGA